MNRRNQSRLIKNHLAYVEAKVTGFDGWLDDGESDSKSTYQMVDPELDRKRILLESEGVFMQEDYLGWDAFHDNLKGLMYGWKDNGDPVEPEPIRCEW